MVKCGVLFEVRAEFLNNTYKRASASKGLTRAGNEVVDHIITFSFCNLQSVTILIVW
jgi:hypothetical protein